MARPPDWRDRAAAELAADVVARLEPAGQTAGRRALVVEERFPGPQTALESAGAEVFVWNRRAFGGRPAGIRPPSGPFDLVFLRMPRSKAELEMTAHMVAAVASPEARLLLYGAKDEGIGSAPGRIEGIWGSREALGIGGHCRVWSLRREREVPLRGEPDDWVDHFDPGLKGLSASWLSYPGVFAFGELDAGTRLLADALPAGPEDGSVLDFGCGVGLLGALQQVSASSVAVDLLDVDAFAVAAARENVPDANAILGDGLGAVSGRTYDRIVTNPPIHRGKSETLDIMARLIDGAPAVLTKRGSLWLVTQKRFPAGRLLEERFRQVWIRAEDPVFRVWEGRRPIPHRPSRR